MSVRRDAWVTHRTANDLAESASKLHERYQFNVGRRSDICALIEELSITAKRPFIIDKKRDYRLEPKVVFPSPGSLGQPRLVVDDDMWKEAKAGESDAVFRLAHELGHLIHHEGQTLNYTDPSQKGYSPPPDERSAETQANAFAALLLVPAHFRSSERSDREIAEILSIPEHAVWIARTYNPQKNMITVDLNRIKEEYGCGNCGTKGHKRRGATAKCSHCEGPV
jgi:hypothetical protein